MNVGDQFRRAISWARGVQSGPKPPSSAKVRWHFSPPVGEGAVALLAPLGGELDVGEVAVEAAGPVRAQHLLHPVQHPLKNLRAVVRPQGAGVQVAEVDAGEQPLVQGAQLQHLVQVPQLIDLAHGLRAQGDVGKPLAVTGPDHLGQGFEGDLLGLPPGFIRAPEWITTRSAPIQAAA